VIPLLQELHWWLTMLLACSLSYLVGRYHVQKVVIRQIKRAYSRLLLAWARDDAAPPHRSPLREEK
jgi:hypothetical protein